MARRMFLGVLRAGVQPQKARSMSCRGAAKPPKSNRMFAPPFITTFCKRIAVWGLAASACVACAQDFRVEPFLQNPTSDAITIRWLSETSDPGLVVMDGRRFTSAPDLATALDYQAGEPVDERHGPLPYLHSVRVSSLSPDNAYAYSVTQGSTIRTGQVRTPLASGATAALTSGSGVRLFVYADSETEPESRSSRVSWPASAAANRPAGFDGRYPATQTEGYSHNLAIIASRAAEAQAAGRATMMAIAGDLVESGGEQRDWDEFWRHNAGPLGTAASNVAIVPAIGNHENYGGPGALGGYSTAAATTAIAKYHTYFETPDNAATRADHRGRYHRVDFGPVTLLTIDSSNGGEQGTATDTNFWLDNALNPQIPDYMPGSEQYAWLETQLQQARFAGQIVFLQYHHVAYSAGLHGYPAGTGPGFDTQSGAPMRTLTPLLAEYGVAAVFSGHDEMYQHSVVDGIHFYDIGIAGDGLRGPQPDLPNPYQAFLTHTDAPEVWDGNILASGGKHYGHLEIDVILNARGLWDVSITPVIAFPILSPGNPGEILGWERRTYDDVVTFAAVPEPGVIVLLAVAAALAGVRRWAALIAVIAVESVTDSAAPVLTLARPVDQARFTATAVATGLSFRAVRTLTHRCHMLGAKGASCRPRVARRRQRRATGPS